MSKSQKIDINGDGTPDIEVKALKQPEPEPPKADVTPKVVEGTEQLKSDSLPEFQRQKAQRHYKINIYETGAANEVKRVFVGVNGIPYTILRGHDVIVPECVVGVLKDAKETKYRGTGKRNALGVEEMEAYDVPSYPFNIIEVYERDPAL